MNWRRALLAVLLVGLPIVLLLAGGMGRDPGEIPSPLPGRAAPEFALVRMPVNPQATTATVDTVHLADHRGDVVVLNFWASWCLACRSEHGALSDVAQRYADRGVHFYGILYNDSPENGRRWIRMMGGQEYDALIDPGARTAIEYGLYGVPETFFIAPDGRVAHKHIGPVTESVLVEQLEALLAERVGLAQ